LPRTAPKDQLERLMEHMRRVAPQVPIILDAKRGDIGSTAEQYAIEAFERYGADAVTLSPFMGFDSVAPYLKYHGKGAFLLCRTSNPGGDDLQNQRLASVEGQPLLYEHVARLAQGPWNLNGQLGLVVGATYPAEIERVRAMAPTLPLLIPGVGAQGGDAAATVKAGCATDGPIIVNSSRAILYASSGVDFADAARREALRTRDTLQAWRHWWRWRPAATALTERLTAAMAQLYWAPRVPRAPAIPAPAPMPRPRAFCCRPRPTPPRPTSPPCARAPLRTG
jgi:orotidine-5'-phosphate decarboxylase